MSEERVGWLRGRGDGADAVAPIELFFDLVYVLAITQLTHHLLDHLTTRGSLQTLLLLLAIWWAWIDTAWFTNFFNPGTRPVRFLLLAAMLISLVMSATLPEAFGHRGLVFAGAFALLQIGRCAFAVVALAGQPGLRSNFERILAWRGTSEVLWIAGGIAHGAAREAFWVAAVTIDLSAAAVGFYIPGLGRSQTTDWAIAGEHLAERCRLFIILALGESILVTGANFGELPGSAATIVAFVVAFIGSATLWWIYFDRADEAGQRLIATSNDPGRLGRSVYTYVLIPAVAGIIVAAAADEVTIAHPHQDATAASTALILGGPVLFLIGITLFKWTLWGYVPRSRLLAIGVLAALVPLAIVTSVLVLSLAATSVLVALVLSDLRAERTKLALTGRSMPESNDQDFNQSSGYAERIPLIEEN